MNRQVGAAKRARWTSAAAFGGAGALAGLALLGVSGAFGALRLGPMTALVYWVPLAFGAPAVLVGALAGPRVAAARSGAAATGLGVGVTVAAAVVYVLGVFVAGYAFDLADGPPVDTGVQELLSPELWGVVLVAALALSPFGALGGYAAWRWLRRSTQPGA